MVLSVFTVSFDNISMPSLQTGIYHLFRLHSQIHLLLHSWQESCFWLASCTGYTTFLQARVLQKVSNYNTQNCQAVLLSTSWKKVWVRIKFSIYYSMHVWKNRSGETYCWIRQEQNDPARSLVCNTIWQILLHGYKQAQLLGDFISFSLAIYKQKFHLVSHSVSPYLSSFQIYLNCQGWSLEYFSCTIIIPNFNFYYYFSLFHNSQQSPQ